MISTFLTIVALQYSPEPLTKLDVGLELSLDFLFAMDVGETIWWRHNQPFETETDPIFPQKPTGERIYATFAIEAIAHAAIAWLLPQPWRTIWQGVFIGEEINSVMVNGSGVGKGFSIKMQF